MGWNNPTGATSLPEYTIDECVFRIEQIAERSGFQILQCEVKDIPTSAVCKKLDTKIRKNAENYICIFIQKGTMHHLWVAPVKKIEKRDVVLVEYDTVDKASFLFEKMESLSFDLSDTPTILDIIEKVQAAFIINSEKITKDFYTGFKKEHTNFAKFITGIDDYISDKDNKNKQWYTSVMLNRLMFCYFIQKKGFLDGDVDYLRHKLEWTQNERGENRFFSSFYKGFLVNLFHGGLNAPKHEHDFENIYGRIPYLNGGMFDVHQIEQEYATLDIADDAFTSLFDFFDKWHWHLDDRMTATGRDINPDVLGYIFEQYINDRAQMGAYYTKEDITEYIGRNTIIPYLMDAVKQKDEKLFKPNGELWLYLRDSGDRYIYDAVKKGHEYPIPDEIAAGIDSTKPNLLERRKNWNDRTPDQWALPTEIWRETIERLQRYNSIKNKINAGEIVAINDFVTYNLDIRQFVYDFIANTQNHLFVEYFYNALQHVTILDPTCGSGAFLFAALNILEPLYEVCINRMQEFNEKNKKLFVNQLQEIENKYRSNIQYFIYKSIILRNLYGVDIMVEATEIAKLRLFLKMVAVVEVDSRAPNLGLDPLPDIDFNIRCGNTLVGYATESELERDLIEGDMFAAIEFRTKIHDEMDKVAHTYETFKAAQLSQAEDIQAFKRAKTVLKERLNTLNDTLNKKLYQSTTSVSKGIGKDGKEKQHGLTYEQWEASHQPFHWLAEFYEIINGNGGFDVIIGNPPYVEYSKIKDIYKVTYYKTLESGNLYSYVIERSFNILKNENYIGMIIPISAFCTARMESLMKLFLMQTKNTYVSNYAERPSKLFEGAERNLSIFLSQTKRNSCYNNLFTTYYYKWRSEHRKFLFKNISYFDASKVASSNNFPKISSYPELCVLKKLNIIGKNIGYYTIRNSDNVFYYKNSGGRYWKFMTTFKPLFYLNGIKSTSSRETHLYFDSIIKLKVFTSILNSTLYFWYYVMNSDARTNNPSDLKDFPIAFDTINNETEKRLCVLCDSLMKELQYNAVMVDAIYRTGDVRFAQYLPAKSKPIIDEIDKVLAKHYGFTEEELDFIINYDIKYRMGDELNEE